MKGAPVGEGKQWGGSASREATPLSAGGRSKQWREQAGECWHRWGGQAASREATPLSVAPRTRVRFATATTCVFVFYVFVCVFFVFVFWFVCFGGGEDACSIRAVDTARFAKGPSCCFFGFWFGCPRPLRSGGLVVKRGLVNGQTRMVNGQMRMVIDGERRYSTSKR